VSEQIYRRLAEHLDRLPGGFASTATGAELRLLTRLFAPAEAYLAVHLTLDREEAGAVARRVGLPIDEVAQQLDEMARRGLIFAVYRADAPTLYQAAPWVLGIYEFQVNNLDSSLLQALSDYRRANRGRPVEVNRQMRTIPIGRSLDVGLEVLPYERVQDLVQMQDRYAVAPCICRRRARLEGGGCAAPEESCLIFGDWADYYVRTGLGRYIDRDEVMQVIARADEANLVLQPSNSKDIAFLCCCCSCCCGVLKSLRLQPKPAEAVVNGFIARYNAQVCRSCGNCLNRCPTQAISDEGGGEIRFNRDRCIGCGLCVKTCASGALRLVRKRGSSQWPIHADMNSVWRAESRL
jgi:Na+-translocating ferredoxin:NAD+ oxidoreductase subunit B